VIWTRNALGHKNLNPPQVYAINHIHINLLDAMPNAYGLRTHLMRFEL
jgi:hypothetical protein